MPDRTRHYVPGMAVQLKTYKRTPRFAPHHHQVYVVELVNTTQLPACIHVGEGRTQRMMSMRSTERERFKRVLIQVLGWC